MRETDRPTDERQTDRQTDRQTYRQTDRTTDEQTDRQTDRQTEQNCGAIFARFDCRLFVTKFAGILQVVCRLFAGYLQAGTHISTFLKFLCYLHSISAVKKKRANGPQTYPPTDHRQTILSAYFYLVITLRYKTIISPLISP